MTNTYANRLRTKLNLAQPTGQWTNLFAYDLPRQIKPQGVEEERDRLPPCFFFAPDLRCYLTGRAKRLSTVTSPAGSFGYTFVGQASRLTQQLSLPSTSYSTKAYV